MSQPPANFLTDSTQTTAPLRLPTSPPPVDGITDPVVDPMTTMNGSMDFTKKTMTAGVTDVHKDGSKTEDALKLSREGWELSGGYTDKDGVKESQALGYSDGKFTAGTSTTQADKSGVSHSLGVDKNAKALEINRTRTNADETSTSTGLAVAPEKVSFSRTSGTEERPNATNVSLGKDEKSISVVRGGNGGGLTVSKNSVGMKGNLAIGKKLKVGGQMTLDNNGTATSKDDVFTAGVNAEVGSKGVNAKVALGNGETTVEAGANAGPLALGGGYTSINKEDRHFGESSLLGPSFVSESTKGSGYSQNLALVAKENSTSKSTESVKVHQKLDERGSYSFEARKQVDDVRAKVAGGRPLDMADLKMNQSAEMTSDSYYKGGGGLDVLAYDANGNDIEQEVSQRAIARTEEGVRIRDTFSKTKGTEESMGVGLGLAYSSTDTKNRVDTEVTEYLLDANDPSAMNYAQDYAQLGLLPSWDAIAPEELVMQLRTALDQIRQGYISTERWQAFLAKNSGLVRQINEHVRANLNQDNQTNSSGVQMVSHDRVTTNTTKEESTKALLFSSTSTSEKNVQTRRYQGSDGTLNTERNWSEEKGGRSRSVVTSGGIGANSALRIEDKGMMRYQQGTIDISPKVLQALGEQLNDGDVQSVKTWRSMTLRAVLYWRARADFLSGTSNAPPPQDDQGLWGRVSNEQAHTLPAIFEKVEGPEDFQALPPDLQLVYAETAAYGGGKAGLYADSKYEAGGKEHTASNAVGSGFDAMAAIALMENSDMRDRAMLALGTHVTGKDRNPQQELDVLSQKLGGGASYLIDEARVGRQVNPDLLYNDPTTWAAELDALFKQGKSANPSLLRMLTRLRQEGGTAQLNAVFKIAASKPREVAKLLAANSIDAPREFIQKIMVGTPYQKELDGWWGIVEGNLQKEEVLKLGQEIFSDPKNLIQIDGSRGLGDCGMDMTSINAKIADMEQSRKSKEIIDQFNAREQARKGQPMYMNTTAQMIHGGKIKDALYKNQPTQLAYELANVRKMYGMEGLDLLLPAWFQAYEFANILHHDEGGAIRKALSGSSFDKQLTALGVTDQAAPTVSP